jgi:hypothetical protein
MGETRQTRRVETWRTALRGDPLPWLMASETPAVRAQALCLLGDEPDDAPAVQRARRAAMRTDPIASILDAQTPHGYWVKPGPGYSPKYRATTWSLIVLDQLGADPRDRRIVAACDYVLDHSQAPNGGFGWSAQNAAVVHCLNGNLLRAMIGFGRLDDARVRASVQWQARSITGDGFEDWHRWTTSAPGFACGINGGLPCAWGAVKAMRGLARIPPRRRTKLVRSAIAQGAEFLLSRDPAVADYPTDTAISANWFKLGFPSGYVADVLQTLEVLVELGHGKDPRLQHAVEFVLSKQDRQGRWHNEYPYRGKLWADVDAPRTPSKWVTLRACEMLRQTLG